MCIGALRVVKPMQSVATLLWPVRMQGRPTCGLPDRRCSQPSIPPHPTPEKRIVSRANFASRGKKYGIGPPPGRRNPSPKSRTAPNSSRSTHSFVTYSPPSASSHPFSPSPPPAKIPANSGDSCPADRPRRNPLPPLSPLTVWQEIGRTSTPALIVSSPARPHCLSNAAQGVLRRCNLLHLIHD
jgi:hypothetical protein